MSINKVISSHNDSNLCDSQAQLQCMFHSAYALVTLVAASLGLHYLPCTKDGDRRSRRNLASRAPSRGSSRGPVTPVADGGASGPAQGGAGGAQGAANASGRAGGRRADGRAGPGAGVGPASGREG